MKFIEEVEELFDIKGRGCVIVPGIPNSFEPQVKAGDKLEFRNPSGTILRTYLNGFEMINRGKPMGHAPFSVSSHVRKRDVEIGAKIYLLSEDDEASL